MSALPAYLDVADIQEQLRALGHAVDTNMVHDLLLGLGFGSAADEDANDAAGESDLGGLTEQLSHLQVHNPGSQQGPHCQLGSASETSRCLPGCLQVSPAVPVSQPDSSYGGFAEEGPDFVWSGRSTAQPPLSALLPPLAESDTASWVLPEDDPAGVPSAAHHR